MSSSEPHKRIPFSSNPINQIGCISPDSERIVPIPIPTYNLSPTLPPLDFTAGPYEVILLQTALLRAMVSSKSYIIGYSL